MAFSERGNASRLKEADEWMKREPPSDFTFLRES